MINIMLSLTRAGRRHNNEECFDIHVNSSELEEQRRQLITTASSAISTDAAPITSSNALSRILEQIMISARTLSRVTSAEPEKLLLGNVASAPIMDRITQLEHELASARTMIEQKDAEIRRLQNQPRQQVQPAQEQPERALERAVISGGTIMFQGRPIGTVSSMGQPISQPIQEQPVMERRSDEPFWYGSFASQVPADTSEDSDDEGDYEEDYADEDNYDEGDENDDEDVEEQAPTGHGNIFEQAPAPAQQTPAQPPGIAVRVSPDMAREALLRGEQVSMRTCSVCGAPIMAPNRFNTFSVMCANH